MADALDDIRKILLHTGLSTAAGAAVLIGVAYFIGRLTGGAQ